MKTNVSASILTECEDARKVHLALSLNPIYRDISTKKNIQRNNSSFVYYYTCTWEIWKDFIEILKQIISCFTLQYYNYMY